MSALLTGKVVVVYGGGGAIGGACARVFAREGARLYLVGRRRDKLDAVARGTEVVVTHELLPEDARPSHSRGWTSGLEHLDEACTQGRL